MPKPINRIHTLKPRQITDPIAAAQRWVVTNQQDENGTMLRVVEFDETGRLSVNGHDLGRGVVDALGYSEYEFDRTLSVDETTRLRELLSVGARGDLLAALRARFTSTFDLEEFLEENGLSGEFWSRRGD